MKKVYLIWFIIIWNIILVGSYIWNFNLIKSGNTKVVLNKSRAFFEQILITRAWNAEHGGVYVSSATTISNPYLKDSLKDIVTNNDLKLTKINPAYMTRQIAEVNNLYNDLHFHITSLKPIRPDNKADDWETKTLRMFENGATENLELIDGDTTSQYRYMAPLITEKSCLQCHSIQGYKYGDIRGGISISFPAKIYTEAVNNQIFSIRVIHLIVYILGIIGLLVFNRMANKYLLTIEDRNKELLKINATKDKFFSIIGHDLKSPFNAILGYSEILVEQCNEKDYDSIEEYAKAINLSSERAVSLLGNLLDWSQTQTGRMKFTPENFDFAIVTNEVIELLNDTAHQKSIVIENKIKKNNLVYADEEMINTVLRNLIANAIKFSYPEGKITLSAEKINNELIVKIADNGVGISEKRIGKLFDISQNQSTSGTQKEKGTGLGLILCKEFIEKNNGRIWVESKVGIGSSFYFSIPLANNNI